ncbi:MAG: TylF/MycF family methyltransferase [Elusimicrobiales bacterium]|nr:TylF/MycF family methyltransferase [Elusimicrobiales bacterium]
MTSSPANLYLDLLKKTLTFTLWPEPPAPAEDPGARLSFLERAALGHVSGALARAEIGLFSTRRPVEEDRREGKTWPACAHTMIGLRRLDNLQFCVETALLEGVQGDLIETGVWRGGACIFMKGVLAAHGAADRKVFVADSFRGLPEPDQKYPADRDSNFHTFPALAVPLEEVKENFRKYGLLDDNVVFLPGWFKDTLADPAINRLAVMRLDGDMYGSTLEALTALYPKLSPGGFCIIDDYALPGCRKAVDDFRARHAVTEEVRAIDWAGAFWRKAKT